MGIKISEVYGLSHICMHSNYCISISILERKGSMVLFGKLMGIISTLRVATFRPIEEFVVF